MLEILSCTGAQRTFSVLSTFSRYLVRRLPLTCDERDGTCRFSEVGNLTHVIQKGEICHAWFEIERRPSLGPIPRRGRYPCGFGNLICCDQRPSSLWGSIRTQVRCRFESTVPRAIRWRKRAGRCRGPSRPGVRKGRWRQQRLYRGLVARQVHFGRPTLLRVVRPVAQ